MSYGFNSDKSKFPLGLASDLPDPTKPPMQIIGELQNQIIDSASIENGATASKAYASGDYVCFQGALCKASKAISQGDTLSIGASANDNLTLTDAAAEFARINSNLSALKVTPKRIDGSKTMQCDTVYLQSYSYTATKKCVLSMNVKGLFNNGYCTGVKFYVNNALMLTEEHDNQAVSYSYMLNAGDTFIVQVRYSNYTLNEIDQRGFLIEFG